MKMEAVSVPLQLANVEMPMDFPFILGKIPNIERIDISAFSNLQNSLLENVYNSPPLGVGASVLMNNTSNRLTVYSLFNAAALHSLPLALSFVSNSILKNLPSIFN